MVNVGLSKKQTMVFVFKHKNILKTSLSVCCPAVISHMDKTIQAHLCKVICNIKTHEAPGTVLTALSLFVSGA